MLRLNNRICYQTQHLQDYVRQDTHDITTLIHSLKVKHNQQNEMHEWMDATLFTVQTVHLPNNDFSYVRVRIPQS